MTMEETTKIVLKLHGAYFSKDKIYNSSELESRINLWDMYFKDFTYDVVSQAVSEWIASQSNPPQISELLPRCKDLRLLKQSPKNPGELKSTAELIWEARHGVMTEDHVSPKWITDMTDEFVKWLRADPKTKKQWLEEEKKQKEAEEKKEQAKATEEVKQSEVMENVLPYEI